ncbi:MAG: carboxymuconolactone decarboxylase family protein [Candidatus Margulisbacteria bacterium]|nr:carboxymuconolactone decarboxylase family protein [Candidatus Margulisiibacteriota bacterium]MBU1729590.1 carboxymuconolactone decarboxylase family protein [Candidatus Margulisiibacteriota bacterium]MBU1956015.1 carboxymuconolactone decarboxylase family protein [Candidatus Margulisiibacteriota bacterium]
MLKNIPEINQKFVDFYRQVFKDGVLSLKTKELIATAVSLGAGCKPCYETHLEKAQKIGSSDEEIREAIAVAEVVAAGKVRMMVEKTEGRAKGSGGCCG